MAVILDVDSETVSRNLKALVDLFGDDKTTSIQEVPPYFDPILGQQEESSPIIDRILRSLPLNDPYALIDWIRGYSLAIRPCARRLTQGSILLLQNYERVLFQWLDTEQSSSLHCPSETKETLLDTVQQLSQDLNFISNVHVRSDVSDYSRTNLLVPVLIRIISQCFRFLTSSHSSLMEDTILNLNSWYETIIPALLPFAIPKLTPLMLSPDMETKQLAADMDAVLVDSKNFRHQQLLDLSPDTMDFDQLNLDVYHLYYDNETNISARAATQLWQDIARATSGDGGEPSSDECSQTKESITEIARAIGIPVVAKTIHSNFFAKCKRPNHHLTNEAQLYMGRLVDPRKQQTLDKGYEAEPSRLLAAINFLWILNNDDDLPTGTIGPLMISVCVELLDSTNKTHAALGAASLIRLTHVLDSNDRLWRESSENIMTTLQSAFSAHTETSAIVVIGRAQYRMLQLVNISRGPMQTLCTRWLQRLQRNTHHVTEDSTAFTILVGGVLPIMTSLARLEDASAMEVARSGLSTFLPLLIHEYVPLQTRTAVLVGLVILMISAYPVMPHHGGKILCHLLAALPVERSQDDTFEIFRKLVVHAMAISLVVCGETARAVVLQIKADRGKYNADVLERLDEAERHAVTLRNCHTGQ